MCSIKISINENNGSVMNENKERREKNMFKCARRTGIWAVINVCCICEKLFILFHSWISRSVSYGKSDGGRRDCFSSVVVLVERSHY